MSSSHRGVWEGTVRRWCRPAGRLLTAMIWVALGAGAGTGVGLGADLAAAKQQLLSGQYAEAIRAGDQALRDQERGEEWPLLLAQGLLLTGRYPEALTVVTNALAADARSLRLRWLAREVFQANGDPAKADEMLEAIQQLVGSRAYSFRDPPNLVVFGRSAVALGVDPKQVLEKIYAPATKADPDLRDTYLARGDLALAKHDFALAAQVYDEGLKRLPDDPDLHYGRARAFADSDRELMIESLNAALKRNPRHVPSLLLLADHRIDGEDYAGAEKLLDQIQLVNPWQPEAWAARAVLAHLKNDAALEATARASALRFWTNNPRVEFLIGQKLSQKYRFAEGAARQRQALTYDPDYLPARAQLANDLLRLGDEAEGWQLAEEVHKRDGYDVAAFNLVTLHETLAKFATLTNAHFIVRMHDQEAAVYGARVLDLLERARQKLVPKYGVELQDPTLVEIFHEPKDFGVRTFGMPENPGYLGVCFGRVITANSPAANRGGAVNWEAVLWHEFCHVVTLQLTRNKMPRWLSEGISVYEEQQADPSWGQELTPKYREMILGGELTPVARLSAAFLMPKTPMHLQFAYFEAGLVVEFLMARHGAETLKTVLQDLRDGGEINTTLERRVAPLPELEKAFAEFAKAKARAVAPGLAWDKPPDDVLEPGSGEALTKWIAANPTNFWALTDQAKELVALKSWKDAKVPLARLVELYPRQAGGGSATLLLAQVHRELGETNAERQLLTRFTEMDAAAPNSCLRLMELAAAAGDWAQVEKTAQRFLAVNPLVPSPYRYLAQAAEANHQPATAISAYRTLLQLDPPNPADVHFRLARALDQTGDPAARREVLQSLEESPRNRAALQLLVKLNGGPAPAGATPTRQP